MVAHFAPEGKPRSTNSTLLNGSVSDTTTDTVFLKSEPSSAAMVMTALPFATAVMTPSDVTVATDSLFDDHSTVAADAAIGRI